MCTLSIMKPLCTSTLFSFFGMKKIKRKNFNGEINSEKGIGGENGIK